MPCDIGGGLDHRAHCAQCIGRGRRAPHLPLYLWTRLVSRTSCRFGWSVSSRQAVVSSTIYGRCEAQPRRPRLSLRQVRPAQGRACVWCRSSSTCCTRGASSTCYRLGAPDRRRLGRRQLDAHLPGRSGAARHRSARRSARARRAASHAHGGEHVGTGESTRGAAR